MDMRRRTYAIPIGIILLTIPCYVSGIALLARAPSRGAEEPTGEPETATPTPTDESTRPPPSVVSVTPSLSPPPTTTGTPSTTPTPSPATPRTAPDPNAVA